MNGSSPVVECSLPVAVPQSPEAVYAARVPMDRRKRTGQFFTPIPIARAMMAWCCRHSPRNLLDPAVGPGIFPASVFKLPIAERPQRIVGYDIDRDALAVAQDRLADCGPCAVDLHHADFLSRDGDDAFDAIVCNPPYIRHHDATVPPGVYESLESTFGVRLSRMTNVYGLFLLRIATLLSERGRAAVITPAEFLNADFGVAVKQALLKSGVLRGFVIFDHAASVFEGILTTAAITLLDARVEPLQPVPWIHVDNTSDLEVALEAIDSGESASACAVRIDYRDRAELDPTQKWAAGDRSLKSGPVSSWPMRPLSDYATCSRGIATGANDFFTLTRGEAAEWGLPDEVLRPCVTKAPQVRGSHWTRERMAALIDAGKKSLLLDAASQPDHPAVKRYLAHGESRELHLRYLTRHRTPWFAIERRQPADIWVSTFGRGRLRFVWNQSDALHLTAFHGLYLRPAHRHLIKPLLAFLHSDIGWAECRRNHRVYGDGLLKFEPRDVERLSVPDFESMSPSAHAAISEAGDAVLAVDGAELPQELRDRLQTLFA